MKYSKKLISTAYHEAGHAVAAIFFDLKFKTVTIIPDKESLGKLIYDTRFKNSEFEALSPYQMIKNQNRIKVALAGPIAEKKFRGRYNHIGASQDYETSITYIMDQTSSSKQADALFKYLDICSEEMFTYDGKDTFRWEAVKRVANTLLEKQSLTQDQVMKVVYPNLSKVIQYQPVSKSDTGT